MTVELQTLIVVADQPRMKVWSPGGGLMCA